MLQCYIIVMDQHSRVVTEYYKVAENRLEDAWYDEVLREEPYYENENTPLEKETGLLKRFGAQGGSNGEAQGAGRMVGEVDIWLLNREKSLMMPVEVKTNYNDAGYGREQLDRVESHFGGENGDWDGLKKLLVEP